MAELIKEFIGGPWHTFETKMRTPALRGSVKMINGGPNTPKCKEGEIFFKGFIFGQNGRKNSVFIFQKINKTVFLIG